MPHNKTKPLLSGLLIVAGIAALSVGGNWAGRKIARAHLFPSARTTAAPSDQAATPALPPRPRPAAAAVRQDHLAAALKRLKILTSDSPNLALDFEASAAVDAILADLSAEELAEVYEGIHPSVDSVLALKVGARWAELDPTTAMKAILAKTPGSGFNAVRVFNEWGSEHPAAALAWLDSAEAPEALGEFKEVMQGNLLGSLVTRDYELATTTFKTLAPDAASQVMDAWGSQCAGDPALRDRLVDFAKGTGKPLDYANLNRAMVQSWPQEDSVGMMNYLIGLKGYLESSSVPAAARPQVDAMAVAVAIAREYDRPALEWWMERYSGSAEVPGDLAAAFSSWGSKYPDKVEQWLAEQPASLQVDGLHASRSMDFANRSEFDKATRNIAAIADPVVRTQAAQRLDYLWATQDAPAAAKWRATLPEIFPAPGP